MKYTDDNNDGSDYVNVTCISDYSTKYNRIENSAHKIIFNNTLFHLFFIIIYKFNKIILLIIMAYIYCII